MGHSRDHLKVKSFFLSCVFVLRIKAVIAIMKKGLFLLYRKYSLDVVFFHRILFCFFEEKKKSPALERTMLNSQLLQKVCLFWDT